MDSLSFIGFISWVLLKTSGHLQTINAVQASEVSNILFCLYIIVYVTKEKSRYFTAFFIIEAVGVLPIYENAQVYAGYLVYVVVYSFTYLYLAKRQANYKTLFGYVIIILFEFVMALDAYYNNDVETIIWSNYEYIVMVIHLYIIATLFRWKAIRRGMGDFVDSIVGIFSPNYNLAFYCYNANKTKFKTS